MSTSAPPPVCRFAPSPNGPLHLGHAYSALRNRSVADALGARLLLRMENIDLARCSAETERAIVEDLDWLGFVVTGLVRRQSEHFCDYDAALDRLAARGLVYACTCTRGDIAAAVHERADWPRDPDGAPLYPGTCRGRRVTADDGRPVALRIDMGRAMAVASRSLDWIEFGEGTVARRVDAAPAAWGDAVLRRKDIPASYHIAVVVDDAAQAVTDIVRGRDLFAATSLHRLLQDLLDLPAPRYHHHRLVRDAAGDKLSKSRRAPALAVLRRAGLTPQDVSRLIDDRLDPALP